MDYISVGEATTKWGILENRIPDVARFSRMWLIPKKRRSPPTADIKK